MAYLGDLDIATGMDTTPRPGEGWYDYMARIGREGMTYSKFIDAQKAGAGVSQPLSPFGPMAQKSPPPPPPPKKTDAIKVLLVGGGLLALAFVLLKKP